MFLLRYGRHVCVHVKHAKPSKALKIRGKVVNISIIYRIPDSWLYSLNGYDF